MKLRHQTYLAFYCSFFSKEKEPGNPTEMDNNHPSSRGDRKASRNAALKVCLSIKTLPLSTMAAGREDFRCSFFSLTIMAVLPLLVFLMLISFIIFSLYFLYFLKKMLFAPLIPLKCYDFQIQTPIPKPSSEIQTHISDCLQDITSCLSHTHMIHSISKTKLISPPKHVSVFLLLINVAIH